MNWLNGWLSAAVRSPFSAAVIEVSLFDEAKADILCHMLICSPIDGVTRDDGARDDGTEAIQACQVVPVRRHGRWGWGVEYFIAGEFPITHGFYAAEHQARAAAERAGLPQGRHHVALAMSGQVTG